MKQPLAAGSMLIGVATDGCHSRPALALEPKPSVCVCGTDTDLGPCPANCPIRTDTQEPS